MPTTLVEAPLDMTSDARPAFMVRDLSLAEFYRADEMFCSGTMGELAAVVQLDGRPIGGGSPGPMTARLSELFAQRTAAEGVQVV